MNILLTNDDGFDKPGIVTLYNALIESKHHVVLAAPAKNASGSSASITFSPVVVRQVKANVYAIEASPATAVLLGASAFFSPQSPPDLVISGINKGANLGPATSISGTIGATTAAIQINEPSIPAIAISTDPLDSTHSEQQNLEHLKQVSDFIVHFVGKLTQQQCKNGLLLPKGLALNINYPPIPRNKIKGIKLSTQGQVPYFKITYTPSTNKPNVFLPVLKKTIVQNDIKLSDTVAYHEGYITIVPLDGNYSSHDPSLDARITPLIKELKP